MARPKPAREQAARIAVICNLTEQSYAEQRSYGVIPILPVIEGIQYIGRCAATRAQLEKQEVELLEGGGMPKQILGRCKPGEEFALTEVSDTQAARQETGEKIAFDLVGAYEIADDVVGSIHQNIVMGLSTDGAKAFAGIFVCEGDRPTAGELRSYREKLKECDEARVQSADSAWATYKNQMFCVDAIPAAKRLGVEDRDWLSTYKPTKDCPMCYTKLDPRAVVCKSCNFVLDGQKAIKAGFLRPATEPEPAKPHKSA